MGQKHREERKEVKALLRRFPGWRENEFGELAKRTSKAEARKAILSRRILLQMVEESLFASITSRVREEICAQEDANFIVMIDQAVECGGTYAP
jgi:hypothetical protein